MAAMHPSIMCSLVIMIVTEITIIIIIVIFIAPLMNRSC